MLCCIDPGQHEDLRFVVVVVVRGGGGGGGGGFLCCCFCCCFCFVLKMDVEHCHWRREAEDSTGGERRGKRKR